MASRKWLAFGLSVAVSFAAGGARRVQAGEINDTAYTSIVTPDSPDTSDPDGESAENPLGRAEWIKSRLNGPITSEFSRGLVTRGLAARRAHPGSVPGGAGSWVSLGPTNANRIQNGFNRPFVDSGRLRNILPDPRNPDVVYVLSSSGGLWKTKSFTASKPAWVPKTDFIFATSGGSAAFGRTPDVVYLGSGDPFDQAVGGVFYKSTDGGDTWTSPIFLPGATSVHDIKVDVSQGSTSADDIVFAATDVGLFRSTDGGASFSKVASIDAFPPLPTEVWSLVRTSAGWIASAAVWELSPNFLEFTVLYVSTDQGATWNPIPDAASGLADFSYGRTTLAATPGASVAYAEVANNDGGASAQVDIFRSTDGGLHWAGLGMNAKVPTNPNIFNPNMDLMHRQAYYNQMILVDPADATGNTVYAGGDLSSAVSRDGGNTWTLLSSWVGTNALSNPKQHLDADPLLLPYVHADFHTAAVSLIGGKKTIFFGSDGGIFYSTDNGKSFRNNANEGLVTHLIYALASGTSHPENVLIGLQDNGTRYRLASTTTYNGSIGGDGCGVGWSQANDNFSFGSYIRLDIRRFTQNPPNDEHKYDALLAISNLRNYRSDANFVTPFHTPTGEADPTGARFFTNTNHYLLGTSDGGNTWNEVWKSTDGSTIRPGSFPVGLAPDDLNYIATIGNGGRVRHTTDGGATWTTVNVIDSIPTWPGFNSTVAWAANHTTLYVGSEDVTLGGQHIAKSVDGGNTWTDVTQWAGFPVNRLLVDPRDPAGNIVYAATWIGVLYTTDGGSHWDFLGSNLPLTTASDLYLPPGGAYLRIATYGRGVWQIALF